MNEFRFVLIGKDSDISYHTRIMLVKPVGKFTKDEVINIMKTENVTIRAVTINAANFMFNESGEIIATWRQLRLSY
jgi:hypothetical protein